MSTYYVNKLHGSANDSNNGTSASTPWLTLGKATSTVAAGDTVYIAGLYRETMTWATSGSSGSPITWIFDTKGQYVGSAYAGLHGITAHDSDDAVATRASCIDFNGKTFNEVYNGVFMGGTSFVMGNTAFASATAYEGVVIENCTMQTGADTFGLKIELNAGTTPTANGIQIRRNRIVGSIDFDWDSNGTANVNLKILIDRNLVFAASGWNTIDCARVTNNGAFTIGGMTITNNTLFSASSYCIYLTSIANTTDLTYAVGNILINPGVAGVINSGGTAAAVIVHKNITVGKATTSSTCTENPPNYPGIPVLLGGLHDGSLFSNFGYSPFKPFEPMAMTGYTNPAIDTASNDYSQTYDLYGNSYEMGRASPIGHQYYFDASDDAVTDTNAAWGSEANIFDASETSTGTCGVAGSNSSNFAFAGGTNAPGSGTTIAKVQTRIRYAGSNANSRTVGWQVYTDSLGESLGSFTQVMTSSTAAWSAWNDLTTPSGGWTWAKVQALEVKVWEVSGGANINIYKIEIGVVAQESAPDIGAVEAPAQARQETTIFSEGSNSARFEGAGFIEVQVPVTTASTTISVDAYYDANYIGTKPQLVVSNIPGIADQTDTVAGSAGAFESLSVNFTPTSAGVVRVRLKSNDVSTTGKCYFDNLIVE